MVTTRGSVARPRFGLLAAVVALVAAIGVALAVTALTATRSHDNPSSSGSGGAAAAGHSSGSSASPTTPAPPPKPHLSVSSATKGVQPWSKPLVVKVSHGTLLSVKATDDTGADVTGAVTGATWASSSQLIPLRTYQLQVYVKGLDGTSAYHVLSVKTTDATYRIYANATLQQGKTVGVGFPITVKFTSPVADADRAAVEKALVLHTTKPVVGAWHWFSAREVHFRPQSYWPSGEVITLHRDLTAVHMASGAWGAKQKDLTFTVGDAIVSTVDAAAANASPHGQTMTVTVNGKVVHVYKVSTGRASLPTLGGVHVVLEKFASIEMKSSTLVPPIPQFLPNGQKNPDYYDEKELWAVRISNGGAFVHFNPMTLKVQGVAAASHGCVNTDLANAQQFYNLSQQGDIVNVVNSPAPPNVGDPGMMDWNYRWTTWTAGSATGAFTTAA